MKKINTLKNDFIFIVLFLLMAVFYYHGVLSSGPVNSHIWRQTDCLSFTRNYAEGAGFLSPQMNLLLADNLRSGLTVGEFPLLYYTVGQLWKLFGESYFTYRLSFLLILFFGVFCFYRSLRLVLNDHFWATALALLLFASPVYACYSVSFLTDGPAFSFMLAALYYFTRYCYDKSKSVFVASMTFFALAGLLKVTSLIIFVFLFVILLLESFSFKALDNRKLFQERKLAWTGFVAVTLVVFLWYYYANYFNTQHGFKFTFNNIYPGSIADRGGVGKLVYGIGTFASYLFFSRSVLFVLGFIGILNLFLWKRVPPIAYLANLFIIAGSGLYFILFFPLMAIHDYYYVALLALFLGILLPFAWFVKTNFSDIFSSRLLKIFLSVFLIYNCLYCYNIVRLKMGRSEGNFVMVGSQSVVDLLKWANWDTDQNWKRFERMQPYIRELGITKEDKVISLPDETFNVSLYFSGQKGWTNFAKYSKAQEIERLIRSGAKYLFVSDPEVLKREFLLLFLGQKIGEYEGIGIYRLR